MLNHWNFQKKKVDFQYFLNILYKVKYLGLHLNINSLCYILKLIFFCNTII